MQSESPVDWKRAEEQFIKPLLERFPDTEHLEEIEAFTDRYDIYRAEKRIENLTRFARVPASEAEAAASEARDFERFGDRMTAWQKYESVVQLFGSSDNPDDQIFVKLAKQQIKRIKFDQRSATDKVEFLEKTLAKAQEQADKGERLDARRTLDSIISLYASNQEVRTLVERARQQLAALDSGASE